MDQLAVIAGALLLTWSLLDSFQTLLATSIPRRPVSISHWYYRQSWAAYRAVGRRISSPKRRERWLARFGPASFVGLVALWTWCQITGWALVWWGFKSHFDGSVTSAADAIYYSGIVYFSIGFGDITPADDAMRLLTVVEGFMGLATLGMVIGFLPSLNAAYSARERQLLKLDDLTDVRITPLSLVQSYVDDGDLRALDAMFDEWADWCATTYDSHTSLPTLVWFRSKHAGHSWITALGVVASAAGAVIAAVPGQERGPAARVHRQAVHLVVALAARIGLQPQLPFQGHALRHWGDAYAAFETMGLPQRAFEDSAARVEALRAQFNPYMEAFIDHLAVPHGFWDVTATDHLVDLDLDALIDNDD